MENTIKTIQSISAKCKNLRMGDESLNIINMLRLEKNVLETAHSRALKEFLSAGELYDYPFLKLFLSVVDLNILRAFKPNFFYCEKYNIDVLVTGKINNEDYAIIIENKINEAEDQESQIERYISSAKNFFNCKEENIYILYLVSGQGKILPTENSITAERRKFLEKKGQFKSITYTEHIIQFLDKILSTWNNESIRTAAYQYQESIKNMFGINNKEKGYVKMENDILYKELKLSDGNASQKLFDFLNDIEKTTSSVYQLLGKELMYDIHNFYKDSSTLGDDEVVVNVPFAFDEQAENLRLHFKNNGNNNVSIYLEEENGFYINAQKEKLVEEINKYISFFFLMIPYKNKNSLHAKFCNYENAKDFISFYNHAGIIAEWVQLCKELEKESADLDTTSYQFELYVNYGIIHENEKVKIKLIFGNLDGRSWIGFSGCDENKVPLKSELITQIKNCFHEKLDTYKNDKGNYEDYSYFCNTLNSVKEFKEIVEKIKKISE